MDREMSLDRLEQVIDDGPEPLDERNTCINDGSDECQDRAVFSHSLMTPVLGNGDGLARRRVDLIPGRCRGSVQGHALCGHDHGIALLDRRRDQGLGIGRDVHRIQGREILGRQEDQADALREGRLKDRCRAYTLRWRLTRWYQDRRHLLLDLAFRDAP